MKEIPKTYEPEGVEEKWYKRWTESQCFSPDMDAAREGKETFSIMIPPPNVTGVLTMGHVLNNTIQDILIRYQKQQGKEALWLPGTDHAGIATQTRVEKKLREEGLTRHDLGREKFLERAVDWRDEHGGIILKQLKKLGCSCDWERAVHTLDEDYSQAVLAAFVKLYERGFIYRGQRMVNWCPSSLTALSDEEVVMKPQKGILYQMKYELVDSPGSFLKISTTRPETIMGDSAVAVHPEDSRYQHLIGKSVWRPFPKAQIPIVGDFSVEKDFGTGVLKVTPAHDKTDFEIGKRHHLEVIDVMNPDGTLNELAGNDFAGMDRFKARKLAASKLDEMGLLIEEEPYENNVGFSERADVPVEPRISMQWFLKYPKVEEAKKVVREGGIQFYPDRWVKTYLHWLDNIQDWCISRQLWWGHRIPVWYKNGEDKADPKNWHVSIQGPSDPENWTQDVDVLDTWASSWLWPFATLGWPDEEEAEKRGLSQFYPTSDLVTGPDIIFFWVARMIMAGLEFMGEPSEGSDSKELSEDEILKRIPFKNVYFTGIIRDSKGRKMSKSLGNSPDPLDLIAKYGADGLRFGIMSIAPKGQDIRFNEDQVEQGRNFCTKLWNVCRFRQMSGESGNNQSLEKIINRIESRQLDLDDLAILNKLGILIGDYKKDLEAYEFNVAIRRVYTFFWTDFCDWYIEVSKQKLKELSAQQTCLAIQDICIRQVLLVLHPFVPFITEEIWDLLGYKSEDLKFIENSLPETKDRFFSAFNKKGIELPDSAVLEIENVREFVSQIRAMKSEFNVAAKKDTVLTYQATEQQNSLILRNLNKIKKMAGLKSLEKVVVAPENAPAKVTGICTFYIDLASSVNIAEEKMKLDKESARLSSIIAGIENKLKNRGFTDKAPAKVVEGARKQLIDNQSKLSEIQSLIRSMG